MTLSLTLSLSLSLSLSALVRQTNPNWVGALVNWNPELRDTFTYVCSKLINDRLQFFPFDDDLYYSKTVSCNMSIH